MFPFLLGVWYKSNISGSNRFIESEYPLRFIRNLEKYYQYYLKDFNFKKEKF